MRAVLLAVLVACGAAAKSAESPAGASLLDCEQVADHVVETVTAEKPRMRMTPADVKDLVSTRCRVDDWSDDAKQCLYSIATIAEGRACTAKLTDEQREAIKTQARGLRDDSEPVPDSEESDWVKHVVEEPGTPTR